MLTEPPAGEVELLALAGLGRDRLGLGVERGPAGIEVAGLELGVERGARRAPAHASTFDLIFSRATAPPNRAKSARRTRRVLVPAR